MKKPPSDMSGQGASGKFSLAYRKNRTEIWNGFPSNKYKRLLPYIKGHRVVELGAAEGVLALMMAHQGKDVFALERNEDRYAEARRLKERWRGLGKRVDTCHLILGDIRDHLDVLAATDTFVAIRSIYYLRNDIDSLFNTIATTQIPNVVLGGNNGRARRYAEARAAGGVPTDNLGKFNRYASIEGMESVLKRHGYRIDRSLIDGDPVVVGIRG